MTLTYELKIIDTSVERLTKKGIFINGEHIETTKQQILEQLLEEDPLARRVMEGENCYTNVVDLIQRTYSTRRSKRSGIPENPDFDHEVKTTINSMNQIGAGENIDPEIFTSTGDRSIPYTPNNSLWFRLSPIGLAIICGGISLLSKELILPNYMSQSTADWLALPILITTGLTSVIGLHKLVEKSDKYKSFERYLHERLPGSSEANQDFLRNLR